MNSPRTATVSRTPDAKADITLSSTVRGVDNAVGTGCRIRQYSVNHFPGRSMSPFVMVDHFHMWEPTFPVHPHAGFSAVTLVFEDTVGSMSTVDSIGHRSMLQAGDLHWTMAGRGIVHTQKPANATSSIHALQIFVNLPGSMKDLPPDSFRVAAAAMPRVQRAGLDVRVVAGELEGKRSPANTPQPVQMLDGLLSDAAGTFPLRMQPEWNAWICVLEGSLRVADGKILQAGESMCASTGPAAATLSMQADSTAHFVVLAGPRIDEPVIQHGPLIFDSAEALARSVQALREGRFGSVDED